MIRSGILVTAVLATVVVAPLHAQSEGIAPTQAALADAPRWVTEATGLRIALPADVGADRRGSLFSPAADFRAVDWSDSLASSTMSYTIGGALAGALVGVGALYLMNDCTETGSMCGLGIPLYAGTGAVSGGLIGFLVSRIRK